MHRVIKSLVSSLSASIMVLSLAAPAWATYSAPDCSDVTDGLVNVVVETVEVNTKVLTSSNTKIVYIEDILNGDQISIIKNSLNNTTTHANILTLQNVLNLKNVLNGVQILSFGDFLSNNNAQLKDIIAVNVLNDGNVLVFCCH